MRGMLATTPAAQPLLYMALCHGMSRCYTPRNSVVQRTLVSMGAFCETNVTKVFGRFNLWSAGCVCASQRRCVRGGTVDRGWPKSKVDRQGCAKAGMRWDACPGGSGEGAIGGLFVNF